MKNEKIKSAELFKDILKKINTIEKRMQIQDDQHKSETKNLDAK